jgi:hypothetical protein
MCGARLGCGAEYCSLNSTRIRYGRAMAQAVSRRPLTAEARFRARVNPCGFCGGEWHWGRFFLRDLRFSPVNIPPSLSKLMSSGG